MAPFLVETRMSMYSQASLPLAHGGVASSSSLLPETEPGGLEEALLQLVQDHHHNSLKLRERAGELITNNPRIEISLFAHSLKD